MNKFDADEYYMGMALAEARRAEKEDEVPIGAVIVAGDKILARTHNLTERLNDVTAHAEILAITAASEALGAKFLPDCTLYVTVEPCIMCAGALAWSRIGRIVFATPDPKKGFSKMACGCPILHPSTSVESGVKAEEASLIMSEFFKRKRTK